MTDPRADIMAMLVQDGWTHKPRPRMHFVAVKDDQTIEIMLKGQTLPFMRHTRRNPDGTYVLERNGGVIDVLRQATYVSRTINMPDQWNLMAEGYRSLAGVTVIVHLHYPKGRTNNGVPWNCWGMSATMPGYLTQLAWSWLHEDEEEGSTGPLMDALQDLRADQEAQARS